EHVGSRRTSTAARTRKAATGITHFAGSNAFKPCGHDRRTAARVDRCEILDPQELQGNGGAQAEDQSDASSHREEGKRAVVGKSAAIHWSSRQTGSLHPRRRSRERHFRTLLPDPRLEHALYRAYANGQACW